MIWILPRFAGLFFDAMVGQMVHALSGRQQNPPRAGLLPFQAAAPPRREEPAAPRPVEAVVADKGMQDKDLEGDAVKLVRYAIVSLRPCQERVLPGGSGEVLVTIGMSGESFVAWMVARFLQSPGGEIDHADKKYLRVAYEVLHRWPAPSGSGCHESRIRALAEIRDAIGDLPVRLLLAGETAPATKPAPAAPPEAPAPAALPVAPDPAVLPAAPAPPESPAPAGKKKRTRKRPPQ